LNNTYSRGSITKFEVFDDLKVLKPNQKYQEYKRLEDWVTKFKIFKYRRNLIKNYFSRNVVLDRVNPNTVKLRNMYIKYIANVSARVEISSHTAEIVKNAKLIESEQDSSFYVKFNSSGVTKSLEYLKNISVNKLGGVVLNMLAVENKFISEYLRLMG
jgi:hypothetical protein